MSTHPFFGKLTIGALAISATLTQALMMIASPVADGRSLEAGPAAPLSCAAALQASSAHRPAGCADPAAPGHWA